MVEKRSNPKTVDSPSGSRQLFQKVLAEMVGTFALVFVGCGAIMVNEISGGGIGHLGICAAFGLVIMVMIYATGHISGAHFNPAVTLAFASIGRFSWGSVPVYMVGQLAAAILASLVLQLLFGNIASMGATSTSVAELSAFTLEVVLTFFLMFVITAVATDARAEGAMAGLAIGGTVALAAIFGGPISGASMNPARSLGPALLAGEFQFLWIYLTAPFAGALAGAWVYRWIQCDSPESPGAEGCC